MKLKNYELLRFTLIHILIRESQGGYFIEPIEKRLETIYDKIKHTHSIGAYIQSLSGEQYFSPIAEVLRERVFPVLKFSDLIEADYLLFFYRLIDKPQNYYYPLLNNYSGRSDFSFFNSLIYKDKIGSIIAVFGVSKKEELYNKLNTEYSKIKDQFSYYRGRILNLADIVKYDLWGTK
jgi:hypothetical protein